MVDYQSDADLADGMERGDPASGEAFFERFRVPLIKFAMSRGFAEADAEELCQETLTEGWFKIPSFQRGRPMARWLCGIQQNLMRRRWEKADEASVGSVEELEIAGAGGRFHTLVPSAALPTSKELAALWVRVQLYMTVARNKTYMAAVQLRHIDGLSYVGVAQALGLKSEGVARVYTRRGLEALRDMDHTDAPEPPVDRRW